MSELDEILEIVDEQNNVIGQTTRGECYEKGLLHRAVNIFIFNTKGQIFLHKRSEKKLKYPGYWDLSCSEHVRPGESFEEAVKRGLKEELSVEIKLEEVIPIHRMDSSDKEGKYHDNELIVTYKGIYDGKVSLDPEEVADGGFFNIEEVRKMIKNNQMQFTPWFLKEWQNLSL